MIKLLVLLLLTSCAAMTEMQCENKVGPEKDKCLDEVLSRQEQINRTNGMMRGGRL
jgi:hypothetical protein